MRRGPEETGGGARLVVALTRAGGRPTTGTLALSVASGWPDFGPGEAIACRARLRELRGTCNPGLPDPTLGLRAAGIDALASVPDAAGIERRAAPMIRAASGAPPSRPVGRCGSPSIAPCGATPRRCCGPRCSAIGVGYRRRSRTAFGPRARPTCCRSPVCTWPRWRRCSSCSRAGQRPAFRGCRSTSIPRAIAAAVVLPAVLFFTLMTGEAVATERSALMLALGLGALIVGRPVSAGPTIAAAVILLLARAPLEVGDVSLQLSVASVAGIALFARGLAPPAAARKSGRALGWLWRLGAATAAATVATGPLVAHHFGEIAPLSPLGNLALVPLVELGVVPLGLGGAIAGALWPPLGTVPLAAAGLAARAALAVAEAFRAWAPLVTCRAPNWLETGALTAAGGFALAALTRHGRPRRVAAALALLAATIAAGSLVARDLRRRHGRALTVTFLDVGQGDAAVVEAPGGAVMVIDGGGTRDGQFDPGARIVEPFLRARGIARVDIVALSHPHPDHLNGLFRIAERFDVGAFWSSGDDGRNPEYRRLLALAASRGIPNPTVAETTLGAVQIVPLGPFAEKDDGERIAAPRG